MKTDRTLVLMADDAEARFLLNDACVLLRNLTYASSTSAEFWMDCALIPSGSL